MEDKKSKTITEAYKRKELERISKNDFHLGKENEEYNTVEELLRKYHDKMQRCTLLHNKH